MNIWEYLDLLKNNICKKNISYHLPYENENIIFLF